MDFSVARLPFNIMILYTRYNWKTMQTVDLVEATVGDIERRELIVTIKADVERASADNVFE